MCGLCGYVDMWVMGCGGYVDVDLCVSFSRGGREPGYNQRCMRYEVRY